MGIEFKTTGQMYSDGISDELVVIFNGPIPIELANWNNVMKSETVNHNSDLGGYTQINSNDDNPCFEVIYVASNPYPIEVKILISKDKELLEALDDHETWTFMFICVDDHEFEKLIETEIKFEELHAFTIPFLNRINFEKVVESCLNEAA